MRDQFISKSEQRRFEAQSKRKVEAPAGCVFFNTPHGEPYKNNRKACGAPVVAAGQHGHLCADHRRQHEAMLEVQRKAAVAHIPNEGYGDEAVTDHIIAMERKALASGVITRVRFGSCAKGFTPDYVYYWTPA